MPDRIELYNDLIKQASANPTYQFIKTIFDSSNLAEMSSEFLVREQVPPNTVVVSLLTRDDYLLVGTACNNKTGSGGEVEVEYCTFKVLVSKTKF